MLLILGSGMVIGILGGVKIIKYLLNTFPNALYSSILGFILASIYFLLPGNNLGHDYVLQMYEINLAIIFAIGFAVLAFWLTRRSK